jgi:hypothetical protein
MDAKNIWLEKDCNRTKCVGDRISKTKCAGDGLSEDGMYGGQNIKEQSVLGTDCLKMEFIGDGP